MKTASPLRPKSRAGVTLLELTVIILALLSLATLLFVGVRAWKQGSDRAACMINIRAVQASVRSYQNFYGYHPGTMPYADHGTQSIAEHLFQKGYITASLNEAIQRGGHCPGGGTYQLPQEDVFPPVGKLYLSCSLEDDQEHKMPDTIQW